ncbi:MAG: hypothetical protein HGA31_02380 [Candidatus Moranbacteria bacterium]|nr:hypothetical protein [Candidatus Moranbacteria bacterium]
MKKIFIISASLFAITVLFLGAYNFAFKNNPKNATVNEKKKIEAKAQSDSEFIGNQSQTQLETVSDTPVFGAAVIGDNAIGFFRDGALRKFSLGGGGESVIVGGLPGKMLQSRWSPDRSKVLALLGNTETQLWYLIDVEHTSITSLKAGMYSPAWSNLSEKIYYFYRDEKDRTSINSAKPDGTEWKEIATAPNLLDPMSQSVPESALLSFWSRPSAFEESSLYTVSVTGGTPEKIFGQKFGASFLWSPDGGHVLISNTLSKGGSEVRLGLANQNGGEFHTLQVPTFTSKAVWTKDGRTVYYALPLSLTSSAVLPDDYFGKSLVTSDSFWKLDVETGKVDRVISPENMPGSYDSTDLFLDRNESYLFYTNRTDNKLYRIALPK